MTVKFRRAGSMGALGALLLTAAGCSTEIAFEEPEGELGQVREAVCDPSSYVPVCLHRCQNNCIDGAAIASCMTVCIGEYCSVPRFEPRPECASRDWLPEMDAIGVVPGCTFPVGLAACYKRCDLCEAPGSARAACAGACFLNGCGGERQPGCVDQKRSECQSQCAMWNGSDGYHYCYANCIQERCGRY